MEACKVNRLDYKNLTTKSTIKPCIRISWLVAVIVLTISVLSMLGFSSYTDAMSDLGLYKSLLLNVTISNEFEISGSVSDAKAFLEYYPREDSFQKVMAINTNPLALKHKDYYEFLFDGPGASGSHTVSLNALVDNKIKHLIINPSKFPFQAPDNVNQYLQPTDIININSDIRALAIELTTNTTSELEAISNIAEWVINNIEYNLSTSNVKASKPSSWVLTNRQGVCDELTSLFISLLKAIGIPARFVSGIAFSNYPGINGWGGHGWAEVFVTNRWLPFDVTYKQLGVIDATHIALAKTIDANNDAIRYEARGYDVSIKPLGLNYDVSILNKSSSLFNEGLDLGLTLLKNTTKIDSYNLVKLKVSNLDEKYKITVVNIATPKDIIVFDNYKVLVIPPLSNVYAYWIVKSRLDDNSFSYEIPIIAFTSFNTSTKAYWELTPDSYFVSMDELKKFLSLKSFNPRAIDCNNTYGFEGDIVNIKCRIARSMFNRKDRLSKVCLQKKCLDLGSRISSLMINNSKSFFINFSINLNFTGVRVVPIKVYANNKVSYGFVTIQSFDRPSIKTNVLKQPMILHYPKIASLEFKIIKNSSYTPLNVNINLTSESFSKSWFLKNLPSSKIYNLEFDSQLFPLGKHNIKVTTTFEDEKGRKYKIVKTISFVVKPKSILDYPMSWFIELNNWFNKL